VSIRILLADDHRIMRDGLRALIEKQPGMEVVAEAENAQGAIELAHELQPDIIIMDIQISSSWTSTCPIYAVSMPPVRSVPTAPPSR
jgi:DNA-binding NarL/FixJ family response regulator